MKCKSISIIIARDKAYGINQEMLFVSFLFFQQPDYKFSNPGRVGDQYPN